MNPDSVTAMVLAWNEAANIERCLAALRWAKRVLVVDSFSTDDTVDICARFPNVAVVQREFDTFADQANFGLSQISTEWVLSLDADYVLPTDFPARIAELDEQGASGYATPFAYAVQGRTVRGVYPSRITLYRREVAEYRRDGHAHRVYVAGNVGTLDARILHDDRKPLVRWFVAQARYAREEADKLETASQVSLPDRIRKAIVPAPILMFGYCLVVRGCLLDGWAGWYYALQRACAETMLSIELLDRKLRGGTRCEK